MKRLICDITVGAWKFDFVTNIEIVSSWDTLTDTCNIEIPRNITFKRDDVELTDFIGGENPVFFRGDPVLVKLGYDGVLKTRFIGRLSEVIPSKPLVLMCEDEMYRLKQAYIGESINFENTTLPELIDKIFDVSEGGNLGFFSDSRKRVENISIGKIAISNTTVAKVLDYLRKKLGIVSYFRNNFNGDNPSPLFVSGLAYSTDDKYAVNRDVDSNGITSLVTDNANQTVNEESTTIFKFGQNVINDDDLVYNRLNDKSILITGTSKQKDNTVITYEAGNAGGDTEKISYPELTQDQLEQFVNERLRRSKYEGFKGSFDAFLEPMVEHGEVVSLTNSDTPEKDGVYLVKEVVTKFGVSGGKQFITLDARVDAPVLEEEPNDTWD